jgi:hypothetical protein
MAVGQEFEMGELAEETTTWKPAFAFGGSSGEMGVPVNNVREVFRGEEHTMPWNPEDYTGGAFLVNWGKYAEDLNAPVSDQRQMDAVLKQQPWGPAVPNRVAQLEEENVRLTQRLQALEWTHSIYRELITRRQPRLSAGWETQPCVTTGARRPEGSDPIPARALRGGWA